MLEDLKRHNAIGATVFKRDSLAGNESHVDIAFEITGDIIHSCVLKQRSIRSIAATNVNNSTALVEQIVLPQDIFQRLPQAHQ
jgi:hypothetical protein